MTQQIKGDPMLPDQCPACGSPEYEDIEPIPNPTCSECGLVIRENVDVPAQLEHEDKTENGPLQWSEFYTVTNETEKQIAQGFDYLINISKQLQLSDEAVSEAAEIFVEAAIQNLANGRSWQLIAAAAVCLGSRGTSEPRPTGSVASAAGINSDRLQNAVRLLQRSLSQEYSSNPPENHISYLCSTLRLPSKHQDRAQQLVELYANRHTVVGKDPVGIASAAIYEAAEDCVTQRKIADEVGITTETIRVRLKELRKTMGEAYD